QKLEKAEGVAVVDRKAIGKVLAEHKLMDDRRPMLSYDAMVRVTAEAVGAQSHLTVTVVDLSMGNVVSTKRYGWQSALGSSTLTSAAKLCASAAKEVANRPKDRIRARLPEAVVVGKVVRLYPLAEELWTAFDQTLRNSPKVVMVQHLEAHTAAEESFLLLMGMSRLPGGRRFVPHADVMVEIRLKEIDAIGKTFEETVIEVGCRVEKAGQGEWHTVRSKVRDWRKTLQSIWQRAAKELEGVDPKAGVDYLNEMQVRRRQAEAELKEFEPWNFNKLPRPGADRDATLRRMVGAASAAEKLDPTWEKAAYLSIFFGLIAERDQGYRNHAETVELLGRSLAYLKRFKGDPVRRGRLIDVSLWTDLYDYSTRKQIREKAPLNVERVRIQKEIMDLALNDTIEAHQLFSPLENVKKIYSHMPIAGFSKEERRRWRDDALDRLGARMIAQANAGLVRREYTLEVKYPEVVAASVKYALADKNKERAKKLISELITQGLPPRHTVTTDLDKLVSAVGDAKLIREYVDWRNRRVVQAEVHPIYMTWPRSALPKPSPALSLKRRSLDLPRVAHLHGYEHLGFIGNRLYMAQLIDMTIKSVPTRRYGHVAIGYLAVNSSGEPRGKWKDLPEPTIADKLRVYDYKILAGKICLGTQGNGLVIWDHEPNKWKVYGAKAGLPHLNVYRMVSIDDHTLFCIGGDVPGPYRIWRAVNYLFDLKTEKVTLIHRTENRWPIPGCFTLRGPWRSEGKLMAISDRGIVEDLLSHNPQVREWPTETIHGWSGEIGLLAGRRIRGDVVVLGKRRFVMCADSLREIDDKGNTLRAWSNTCTCFAQIRDVGFVTHPASTIEVFGDIPGLLPGIKSAESVPYVRADLMGTDGTYLLLNSGGIVCYDPEGDTWYGPVDVGKETPVLISGKPGILVDGNWVPTSRIISTAKRAKRVARSEQLSELFWRRVGGASLLDKAKFAFGRREFDKAVEFLEKVLEKEPENPHALIIMALTYETYARDDSEKFLEYCRRMASTRNAELALTGTYLEYLYHIKSEKWADAAKTGQEMLKRFRIRPGMAEKIRKKNAELAAKAGG
ncbi:MAG: hypothetical protein AMS16_03525, partial [Planctomycetes bacterium DG_58]